jgi:hypothetical protein
MFAATDEFSTDLNFDQLASTEEDSGFEVKKLSLNFSIS